MEDVKGMVVAHAICFVMIFGISLLEFPTARTASSRHMQQYMKAIFVITYFVCISAVIAKILSKEVLTDDIRQGCQSKLKFENEKQRQKNWQELEQRINGVYVYRIQECIVFVLQTVVIVVYIIICKIFILAKKWKK